MSSLHIDAMKTQSPLRALENDANDATMKQTAAKRIVRSGVKEEIAKQVVRKKLSKLRHLVVKEAISPEYLDSLFPTLLQLFKPQTVTVRALCASCYDFAFV